MRKLRTQAIGQVRPRACDLRERFRSRSRRGPWGQLAMRHRRREARARSFDRTAPQFPPFRRRLAEDGFRTGFAASVRSPPRHRKVRRRVDRRSYSNNSPFFAPALTGQGRGDDRGKLGRVPSGRAFFSTVAALERQLPG